MAAAWLTIPAAFALLWQEPAAVPQDQGFKISADVERVVLPVTVTDGKGEFVAGLEQSDFIVYEDDRPQPVKSFSQQDVPVTVGLVIDNSSSMRSRRPHVNLAAARFVRLSNPEDEVFVVNFNDRVSFGLPEGTPFTSDGAVLNAALEHSPPAGKTALYDAIAAALDHAGQGHRDRKALIVVSDGGDTASRTDFHHVLHAARASQVTVYPVQLFSENEYDPDRRPELLRKLAHATGGEMFQPKDGNEIVAACRRIASELRSQYTIAYAPENSRHDGGYRHIRVTVRSPGRGKLTVRTRPGYFAPSETATEARTSR